MLLFKPFRSKVYWVPAIITWLRITFYLLIGRWFKQRTSVCEICGVLNPTWFAENWLWNKYSNGYHFLCPNCFIKLSEAQGFDPTGWKLIPEVDNEIRKD